MTVFSTRGLATAVAWAGLVTASLGIAGRAGRSRGAANEAAALERGLARVGGLRHVHGKLYRFDPTDEQTRPTDVFWVPGQSTGYSGQVLVAVTFDGSAVPEVTEVDVLSNQETPYHYEKVIRNGYLDRFVGMPVDSSVDLQDRIDAVTGATITSRAIADAVRGACRNLAKEQPGLSLPYTRARVYVGPTGGFLLAAFAACATFRFTAAKRFARCRTVSRWLFLALALILTGFFRYSQASLSQVATLLLAVGPPLWENIGWYLLVPGLFLFAAVAGLNVYCGWACPFGAAQEFISMAAGTRLSLPARIGRLLRRVRPVAVWAVLLWALAAYRPSSAGIYEPYAVLFEFRGHYILWMVMFIILPVAIFVHRPWCRYFCPIGTIEELLLRLRVRVMQSVRRRAGKSESETDAPSG